MAETKRITTALAPEIIELGKKIALKLYGNENYNFKAIVDYCINHELEKMEDENIR